ncbi:hypothetical protein B0H19DRAFT_1334697 [Mycena capillaripes]|nr:hypothetical protein B0H19DRAFT_1334697 [Mycena capillaripes]
MSWYFLSLFGYIRKVRNQYLNIVVESDAGIQYPDKLGPLTDESRYRFHDKSLGIRRVMTLISEMPVMDVLSAKGRLPAGWICICYHQIWNFYVNTAVIGCLTFSLMCNPSRKLAENRAPQPLSNAVAVPFSQKCTATSQRPGGGRKGVGESRNGPGTEQPEPAGAADKSIFTRKTDPRDARRMAEVKRRIIIGKDLPPAEREQVDALLDEFVDVFGLSMSEVYAVPGAEHRLDIPEGMTFKTKVNQRPLSPPQRVFFNKVLDEMLEAEVIRPITDVKCCGSTNLAQNVHDGGGLSIEELQRRVDDQCVASGFESAFRTGFQGTSNAAKQSDMPAEQKWRVFQSFKALNDVMKVVPVPQGDIRAKQQRLSGHRWVHTFDFASGFYACTIREEDQPYI